MLPAEATMPRLDETQSPLPSVHLPKQGSARGNHAFPGNNGTGRLPPFTAHASPSLREQDAASLHAKLPVLGAASVSGTGKRMVNAQAPRQHVTAGSQVRDGSSPRAAAPQSELQARVAGGAEGRAGLQAGSAGQRQSQTPGKGAEQSGYRMSDSNGVRVDGNGAGPSSNGGNPGPSNGTAKEYSVGDKVAALASFDQSYRELSAQTGLWKFDSFIHEYGFVS